jgi:hypothetical protein
MQPDHFRAERDGFGEQLGIGGERNMQAGTDEIGLEARRERRMRHDGGEIGHHVFGFHRLRINVRQMRQKRRLDVRLLGTPVTPKRIYTSTASVVMIEIRNKVGKSNRGPYFWRSVFERS